MEHQWKSTGLYEHPAKHQTGSIVLSTAGVYCLQVGGAIMSCPQDWAAAIHADETGQAGTGSMIVRKIPDQLRRDFKSRCAAEGITQQGCVVKLMTEYVARKNNTTTKEMMR